MHRNRAKLATVTVTLLVVILTLTASVSQRAHAGVIARSRSNICNNRMLPPSDARWTQAMPSDLVVLCQSCEYPLGSDQPALIVMDNQTGEIYAYGDEALIGKGKPRHVGKFIAVGQPIIPATDTAQ